MDELVDRMLGRYKILKVLGEGGMGVVLKARDVTLQRDVAIKVLHPHLSRQPNLKERFLQEARSAAKLDHPSIVKVFDFGKEGAVLYIVMEFIAGANLRQLLEELKAADKWVVLDEALGIMQEICLALDHAHKHGVLHRDIKPGNIMLKPEPCDGLPYRPVLTDLGLAKLLEGTPITQEGTSMGTPAYMSPEQALGRPTDARSDVYSLGVLLFELTVGRLPFPARTITEAIRYHTKEPPPQPRSIQPDLPLFLERVILRAMAKEPERRFPDTATMAQALEAISPTVAQIAASTIVEGGASLVTQLQQTLAEEPTAPVRDLSPTPPPDLAEDNVQITGPDGKSRLIPVRGERMTIGRAEDNDIVLEDGIVSGHHARIDFDGHSYYVVDLDSRNGTFLGNSKLLPGTPEEWPPRIPVRMGKTFLHLVRGGQQPVEAIPVLAKGTAMVRPDGSQIEARLIHSSLGAGRVAVFMEQTQLSVEPGGSVTASILLLNRGTLVDNFQIALAGIPAGWIKSVPPTVRLMPEAQQPATIVISPPRSPESAARDYPFNIGVTSVTFPDEVVEVGATLTVLPFYQFSSTLHPQRLRPGKSGAIKIKNEGNIEQVFSLTWEDRGDELDFRPPKAQVTAGAGQEAEADFSALLRQKRWVGGENVHPFVTKISLPQGVTQSQPGEVISRGVIAPWILPLLFLGCIALAAAAVLAFQGFRDQFAEATRAVQAEETLDALAYVATQTATVELGLGVDTDGDGLSDVRESELGTDPSKADTDGDGLSDQEETSLGTLPSNPDSDGDGLSDGDERRNGSDPWVVDTDGDTLSDGDEVNGREVGGQIFHTSPINKDTDGDGQPDNVDPDPGNQPTPTLEPTATPTFTPTPSPEPTATPTLPASSTPTASPTPSPSPTTWSGGVVITGLVPLEPVVPVLPGVLVPLNQAWEHDFHLVGSRTIYYIRLTEPGMISARAVWTGSQSNLALMIGADGVGTTVRQDGGSPLVATWTVTQEQFDESRVWRVTVASFGSGSANGTVEITYPSGSTVTPFSDGFTIADDYALSVAVLVLNRAGTINAQVSWSGTPSNLALILNGPGQVGYYARRDGPTGLDLSYEVTQADFDKGDTWRVSLVSFSQADATGTVTLTHP
jgi:serine/threonine protein kinase